MSDEQQLLQQQHLQLQQQQQPQRQLQLMNPAQALKPDDITGGVDEIDSNFMHSMASSATAILDSANESSGCAYMVMSLLGNVPTIRVHITEYKVARKKSPSAVPSKLPYASAPFSALEKFFPGKFFSTWVYGDGRKLVKVFGLTKYKHLVKANDPSANSTANDAVMETTPGNGEEDSAMGGVGVAPKLMDLATARIEVVKAYLTARHHLLAEFRLTFGNQFPSFHDSAQEEASKGAATDGACVESKASTDEVQPEVRRSSDASANTLSNLLRSKFRLKISSLLCLPHILSMLAPLSGKWRRFVSIANAFPDDFALDHAGAWITLISLRAFRNNEDSLQFSDEAAMMEWVNNHRPTSFSGVKRASLPGLDKNRPEKQNSSSNGGNGAPSGFSATNRIALPPPRATSSSSLPDAKFVSQPRGWL
eukprot:GHVT01066202.1.p1 GENE.GHVT01066202.1~~GHVT01066202.1.p1  ORF type:complete len:423 (+),score=79.90 GHVT01066202.1:1011-2279(+)